MGLAESLGTAEMDMIEPAPTVSLIDSSSRLAQFIRGETRSIRAGGPGVLLRKALMVFGMGLAIIPLLVMRLLRPLFVIRFGRFDSHSMGPLCAVPDIYLCERGAGMHGGRVLDLFCHSRPVCNQQIKRMWGRRLRVSGLVEPLFRLNAIMPGGRVHQVPWHSESDYHGVLGNSRPNVSFSPEEEKRGRTQLGELGVPDGSPFVCFHARDPAFQETVFPGVDLSFRDFLLSSIQNCLPAVEELVRRGYFALRMGAVVKEPLANAHPNIIDYASQGRTDFLDIYLGAKCRFYICPASGIMAIPTLFRRPIVTVNFVPMCAVYLGYPGQLIIPKKLWLRDERRFLTFPETIRFEKIWLIENDRPVPFGLQYARNGIDVIENTGEEIAAVALEMDERLKGTWETTKEDEELQNRVWSLFESSALKSNGEYLTRLGAEFLRQNQYLLD